MEAIKVTHYAEFDPAYMGDYVEVELKVILPDGVVIDKVWGDGYHDKGDEKCDGYLECLKDLYPTIKVRELDVADREI